MTNNIYKTTSENIEKAASTIKAGGLVAMPTETVYGLGANAFDNKAVASIFAAKNRPAFNPLISHIYDIKQAEDFAIIDDRALSLAEKFWPGALTLVLNRKENFPYMDMVCAGLNTVTIRIPDNKTALELIKKSGVAIAAPSANTSGTISPTSAIDVYECLGDKVDMILDGGKCKIGLESTIIDLTTKDAVMLRPGGIAIETIEEFLGEEIKFSKGNPDLPKSPGQLLSHYAPNKSLRINVTEPNQDEIFIGFGDMKCDYNLSKKADFLEAASNLFSMLKLADKDDRKIKIAIAPIPNKDLGLAINNRLERASYPR